MNKTPCRSSFNPIHCCQSYCHVVWIFTWIFLVVLLFDFNAEDSWWIQNCLLWCYCCRVEQFKYLGI